MMISEVSLISLYKIFYLLLEIYQQPKQEIYAQEKISST